MKKTLIALAALAVSGAAMAQSSVTLYGIVDAWVGQTSSTNGAGVKTKVTKLDSGGFSGSRWGVTGTEDLGGGLKAVFRLESGFDISKGAGSGGFNRQSYVGLAGGFGEVQLGNVWTAMDDMLGAGNSAFDSAFAPGSNVLIVNAAYKSNPGNSIKYISPDFGGLSGAFSYSLDESNAAKEDISDFRLSYAAGPIAANFAYQVQGDVVGANDLKLTALNGSYDLGVAKIIAGYGQSKITGAKGTDFQIGAEVPLSSALAISGGFAQSKLEVGGGSAKSTGFGIAANYMLSKRTNAYAGYQQSKVKSTSIKADIFAVGVRHTF